jgi:hypothetical protein
VPELGEDLDIRVDLSRYRVWWNGDLVAESGRAYRTSIATRAARIPNSRLYDPSA